MVAESALNNEISINAITHRPEFGGNRISGQVLNLSQHPSSGWSVIEN